MLYHVVFATKDRQPLLEEQLRPALCAQLGDILAREGGILLIANGMSEHVHILAKLRPDCRISDLVSDLKSRTSGWIHRTYPSLSHFAWQRGYGAFTVSQSQAEVVRRYIANQEEHHRKVPFGQEYLQLLRKHGAEVTEQDLWQ